MIIMETENIPHPEHARLWNEGLSFAQVGKRLGETRGAAAGKLHRMKGKVTLRVGHAPSQAKLNEAGA